MVKVECDGCKSPYQVDEKRIPATGLKMRCPKCGTSFLVTKPGSEGHAALPAAAPPPRPGAPPPPPKKPPGPPRPAPKATPAEPAEVDVEPDDEGDLPAPAPRGGQGVVDFPAARAEQPKGFGGVDFPAVRTAPPKGFGEIDLAVDLPSPTKTGSPPAHGVGSRAAAPPAARPLAPPAPHATASGGFGEIDLPVVHGNDGAQFGATSQAAAPRGGGFGEIDLPSPAADLPSPFAALPAFPSPKARAQTSLGGFGEIDLPMSSEAALPSPAMAGLPSPAMAGLPSPAMAGLPSPAMAGLPSRAMAGLPAPATATGMPQIASGTALPMTAEVLPPVRKPGSVGTVVGAELYGDDSLAHPDEHQQRAVPFVQPRPRAHAEDALDIGDEISLGGREPAYRDDDRSGAPAVFGSPSGMDAGEDLSDTAGGVNIGQIDSGPQGDAVGGEVELGGSVPLEGEGGAAGAFKPRRDLAGGQVELAPKRTNARRYAVLGIVLALVGGGSLAVMPGVGAFGYYFISDQVNASAHRRDLNELRARVQDSLDSDTATGAAKAIADARAAHDGAVRYAPISGYAAYVAFSRSLRFGRRSDDEAYAKQLLTTVTGSIDDAVVLANAGQDAATGQLARARQSIAGLAQRAPNDVDVASLAGEIELIAKEPAKAVEAWKRAASVKKSARTLYGLARAELAAGDAKGAEASAKDTLKLADKHIGARILVASVAWPAPAREQEAMTLLASVTEDASLRGSASDAELVEAYTVLGRIHLARSRMTAAEQAFAAALKLDPVALQALIGNGELFYREGRFTEAQARFENASRADADSLIAQVGMAKTWLALEHLKEGKDLLKKLRAAKPNALVAYWLGRADEALGNKKEAEAGYVDAIKIGERTPEVVDAYVALSRLLAAQGRADDAASRLAEAVTVFPESPALDQARGEVALQTGRCDDAKSNFEHALERRDDLGTRFDLGIAERCLRNWEASGKIFDQVAAIDKEYPGLALERGLLFEQTGQSDRAVEMYQEALRKAPNDVDLKFRVASTQVMAGHAKQAIPVLKEVAMKRPGSAEVSHFLGRAQLVSGSNLAEAMRNLVHATELDGNHAQYFLYVGWAANEIGQPGEAERALKRALELDRGLGDAYWQRAVLLQKQGLTLDALADVKTALDKSPSRYEAYATMALCYQDQSNWAEAEAAWRNAIAKNDGVAEWHYRLGKILFDHRGRAGAAAEVEKALTVAEAADIKPVWAYDAHFLLAESVRGSDRDKAILHYHRFQELAPRDRLAVDGPEVQRYLDSMGDHKQR